VRNSEYARYASDPIGYARDVLGVRWWHKQEQIALSLLTPPYRTLVKACHKVGKRILAVDWSTGGTTSTIPACASPQRQRQGRSMICCGKEVRVQRRGRSGFRGAKAPRLESAPDHFAHGFTAKDGDSFQGNHSPHTLFIFDEAVGVDGVFFETAESMFSGEGHAWLCIHNPTDTSSQVYAEELSGGWHVISLSVLDHPNVAAELAGLPPPFPSAIRLARVDTLLRKWCRPVNPSTGSGHSGKPLATDVEWPPGSGEYLRPGPIAEARLLGRWPSQATNNVWSDGAFQSACALILSEPDEPVQVGCDVARFGDDWTTIHVRRGGVSLHHESANGWDTAETAGRLKEVAREWGRYCGVDGRAVPVVIDDDGVGGGVVDQADGYNFIGLSGQSDAVEPEDYPNRRSELWFTVAERAFAGRLSLARLSEEARRELRRQAMAPTWKLDSDGRRVVEPKDKTKERIKRSPDDMDGMNLAYAVPPTKKARAVKLGIWKRP
jgi:hypothetical protein